MIRRLVSTLLLAASLQAMAAGPLGNGAFDDIMIGSCATTCQKSPRHGEAQCFTYCRCASAVDRDNPRKWDGGEVVVPPASGRTYQQAWCASIQWPDETPVPPPLPGEDKPGAEGIRYAVSQYVAACKRGPVSSEAPAGFKQTKDPLCASLEARIAKIRSGEQRGAHKSLPTLEALSAQHHCGG